MRAAFLFACLWATPAVTSVVWAQAAGPFPEQADEAPQNPIAACAESLPPDVVGPEAVEAACPGIEQALQESEFAPFISDSQRAELSRDVLFDLQELQERHRRTAAADANVIDVSTLPPLLESLQQERQVEAPLGWFGRLKQWLRERLERAGANPDSRLSRWFDFRIPEEASRAIVFGLVVLVILTAIAILVNEARVAGLLGRRTRKERESAAPATGGFASPTLEELERAAPRDQPSVLLRLLVATLVSTGRLRADRSLTHRELGRRAAFEDPEQRDCFQRVAALAERVVYGGGSIPADAAQVIEAGRSLDVRLNAQARGAAS